MGSFKLSAGAQFPQLSVRSLEGQSLTLGMPAEGHDWQMVVVYRGQHCPLCTRYLQQLNEVKAQLSQLGIDLIAVSADSREQAEPHISPLGLDYPVGYGLTVEQMRELGLYISEPRSPQETDHDFAEPGLFVVNHEGAVQVLDISNGPFARPGLATMVSGLSFIRNPANNYPIRGTK